MNIPHKKCFHFKIADFSANIVAENELIFLKHDKLI